MISHPSPAKIAPATQHTAPSAATASVDLKKGEHLLTKKQLAERLGLTSTRSVDELVRRRAIPIVRLGHRTARFSWPDVRVAIDRLTVREVC